MRRFIAVLSFICVVLVAAGVYVLTRFEGPPEDHIADLVPAQAAFYASFFVDPSTAQKKLLESAASSLGEDADAGDAVSAVLDTFTSAYGVGFDDIEPWLGRQVAVFAMADGSGAVVAEVVDREAAEEAATRAGAAIFSGDLVVFGDEVAVNAARLVQSGDALPLTHRDGAFSDTLDGLPEDRLALAYANESVRRFDLPAALDGVEMLFHLAQGSVALRAHPAGLELTGSVLSDGAVMYAPEEELSLDVAPAGAWLAGALPNLSAAAGAVETAIGALDATQRLQVLALLGAADVDELDAAVLWAAGSGLPDASAGIEAIADSDRAARAFASDLDALAGPALETSTAGHRVAASLGARGTGSLRGSERYREAAQWIEPLDAVIYLDAHAGADVARVVASAAGMRLPDWADHVDRVIMGIDDERSPSPWSLVISLDGRGG